MGIDHVVLAEHGEWAIWVPADQAARAGEEVRAWHREHATPEPPPRPRSRVDNGWAGVLAFLLVIWGVPTFDVLGLFGWDWRNPGILDAGAVRGGEWWRTLTALTLHADLPHLLGNTAFGALFGLILGRHLGSGAGWLLVLVAAGLANGVNVLVHGDGFRALGASTANFAALGIVGGFLWRSDGYRQLDWKRAFAPVFAGACILAFTGSGSGEAGDRTDVLGHLFGFLCGVGTGVVAARLRIAAWPRTLQPVCGIAAAALLGGAWWLAQR